MAFKDANSDMAWQVLDACSDLVKALCVHDIPCECITAEIQLISVMNHLIKKYWE